MDSGVVIVVQARTGSTRFPGKALIDFLGTPMAIFAARRAANCGHKVVIATSDDSSDDALVEMVLRHGIKVVRGPLDNVLERFVLALEGLSEEAIVVRLTADNVLPDGGLIGEVLADFKFRKLDYLTTTDPISGLPHGCSVEVTRVGHIRRANALAKTDFDREHVTPWIRERYVPEAFTKYSHIGRGHFRCTVDSLDDYFAIIRAFPKATDPVTVSWHHLVNALEPGNDQPFTLHPVRKLVLGTAQIGMPYGIVRTQTPVAAEAATMIKLGITNGVEWLDTARAYGRSEEVIGKALASGWNGRCRVTTKLSPMYECPIDAEPALAAAIAENSLLSSCLALGVRKLDSVLLHRASHLQQWHKVVIDVLKRWQDEQRLNLIGVSVQTPNELLEAIEADEVGQVQLPFNVLDDRWLDVIEKLRRVRKEKKLIVHVRSTLLQGLLLSDDPKAWKRAHVSDPSVTKKWLCQLSTDMGYTDVMAFCLAYVRSQDWIDGVVVGIDGIDQLVQVIASFEAKLMAEPQLAHIAQTRPKLQASTLDPSKWNPVAEVTT